MNQNELRILMESYRADPQGAGDAEFSALLEAAASDPAVREELEAVQAWDSAISVAMHDVPVPVGLADRLLKAAEQADQEPVGDVVATPAAHQVRWWNRWPVRIAAASGSVAALAMIVFYVVGLSDKLTEAQVAQSARSWIVDLDEEAWQQSAPPAVWPKVQQMLNFPGDSWQNCSVVALDSETVVLDAEAVVIRANVLARSRAWLFVIETPKGRNLRGRPPYNPDSTTGGICVGVWKDGDHVYVLAAGTRETYHRIVNSRAVARVGNGQGTDRG